MPATVADFINAEARPPIPASAAHRPPTTLSPTTICHPVYQLGRGGLERQLLQVIDRLPADQFRHVLVIRGRDEHSMVAPDSFRDNVTVVSEHRGGRDRLWSRRLARIVRRHDVDLIHVRGFSMLIDAVLAGRSAGAVPVAFSFHGFEGAAKRPGRLRRLLHRAAITRCAARWAVSREACQAVARCLGVSPLAFDVLPNGVDLDRYRPTAGRFTIRRRLGLPVERDILLSVGNLKPVKGHRTLLDAIGGMRSVVRELTIVLVGGDYLDGDLQRRADAQLPDFDIRFVGQQEDVLSWYQAADVFVQPSRFEGMSNALLEAMACGLPVVATDVGGNRELVEHGRGGLLVPPGDPVALAGALQYILRDAHCRASLGVAARSRVRRDYGADASAERYGTWYRRLHARSGRSGPLDRRERLA